MIPFDFASLPACDSHMVKAGTDIKFGSMTIKFVVSGLMVGKVIILF